MVVSVDRADIGQPQRAEQVGAGRHGAVPQRLQVPRHAPDRRRIGAGVVVEDDDRARAGVGPELVERLEADAAGERAVADHCCADAVLAGHPVRTIDAVRPGDGSGGVGVLDHVVRGLPAIGVSGHSPGPAQTDEVGASGQHLVHIGLMTGVEDDRLVRGAQLAVQRDGELDDAEVRPQVAAGAGGDLHEPSAQAASEGRQRSDRQRAQLPGILRDGGCLASGGRVERLLQGARLLQGPRQRGARRIERDGAPDSALGVLMDRRHGRSSLGVGDRILPA